MTTWLPEHAEIETLRSKIDDTDDAILRCAGELVTLFSSRNNLVGQVSEIKQGLGMEALQPGRFAGMLERLSGQAEDVGVSPELVSDVWHVIHKHSVSGQQNDAPKSTD